MSEQDLPEDIQRGKTRTPHISINLRGVLYGHKKEVSTIRFFPSGTELVSLDEDGLCLWDTQAQILLRRIEAIQPLNIDVSNDGMLFVSTLRGGLIRIWTKDGERVADLPKHESEVTSVVFAPEGRILASGDTIGLVRLWDVMTRQLLISFQAAPHGKIANRPREEVEDFTFTPDGQRLAMVCQDQQGMIQVWQIEQNELIPRATWLGSLCKPSHYLFTITFSPDGRFLAAASFMEDVVWLFDAHTLTPAGKLTLPDEAPKALAFSPDGRFLATAGGAGTVWIWNINTQQIVTSFEAHTEGCDYRKESQLWALGGIDWTHKGTLIATSGTSPATFYDERRQRYLGPNDYTIKLWNVHIDY